MIQFDGAFAPTNAAPDAAPPPVPAFPFGRAGAVRCFGGRSDGVQTNWWNTAPPAPTPAQPPAGGLLGALQALVNAFGGALASGVQQFFGATAARRSVMDESRPV
jgi:hypothetical protein